MSDYQWIPPLVFRKSNGTKVEYSVIDVSGIEPAFRWGFEKDDAIEMSKCHVCDACKKRDQTGQELYEHDIIDSASVFYKICRFGCKWELLNIKKERYSQLYGNPILLNRHGNANDAAFMAKFKAEHPELFDK